MAADATNLSMIKTTVTNRSGGTMVFSWLPPHGKSLANNASVTFNGDIYQYWPRQQQSRYRTAFENAIALGTIEVKRDIRQIAYVRCSNAGSVGTITAGDIVWWDSTVDTNVGSVRPALDISGGSLTLKRQALANALLGRAISAHTSAAATVTNFAVDTSPLQLHEFACVSGTYLYGTMLTINDDGGTGVGDNITLKATATASEAIARCHKEVRSAATLVTVQLIPAYFGANSAAQV